MTYNSTVHSAHKRTPHEAMFGWKMHCVYDAPDEEENVGVVDEDNQTSISDAGP